MLVLIIKTPASNHFTVFQLVLAFRPCVRTDRHFCFCLIHEVMFFLVVLLNHHLMAAFNCFRCFSLSVFQTLRFWLQALQSKRIARQALTLVSKQAVLNRLFSVVGTLLG